MRTHCNPLDCLKEMRKLSTFYVSIRPIYGQTGPVDRVVQQRSGATGLSSALGWGNGLTVAVGQEEDAFLAAGFPEAPDNLEGGVGFAGAGGHDQEDAVLALGDGLNGGIYGIALVVAGGLATRVVKVILEDDLFSLGGQALPGAIPGPKVLRRGEVGEREVRFLVGACVGAVVEDEGIAIGGKNEGDIESRGIFQSLLHPRADAVVVVLGLDQGDGNVRLVIEDVIGPLGLAAGDELAAHDDPALGEADFLADLREQVPAGRLDGGGDELRADVALAEVFFVHGCFTVRGGDTIRRGLHAFGVVLQ
jgi:hypothetical protein